jgi:hypothetical protein
MSIHTTTTHSFGIDRKTTDPMMSCYSLARAHCYPHGEWFFLTVGGKNDDVRITWEEWDQICENVKELRKTAQMEVILSAQGTPTKEGEV